MHVYRRNVSNPNKDQTNNNLDEENNINFYNKTANSNQSTSKKKENFLKMNHFSNFFFIFH